MLKAPAGQLPMLTPRPSQNLSLITVAFPLASLIAPSAHAIIRSEHAIMQLPQPLHILVYFDNIPCSHLSHTHNEQHLP